VIGLYVSALVACFRRGMAREFFETHPVPPPSTCYDMPLSLMGEHERRRHRGCHGMPALPSKPATSVVLRTMWRVKSKTLSEAQNLRPDFQQLLTHVKVGVWLDSIGEAAAERMLEERVAVALDPARRVQVERAGGLCLGESTHHVDEVLPLARRPDLLGRRARTFLLQEDGPHTFPVWVDHVRSAGTRWATGRLVQARNTPAGEGPERRAGPVREAPPAICSPGQTHALIEDAAPRTTCGTRSGYDASAT
jgi:CRISPR-associated protein Cas5t